MRGLIVASMLCLAACEDGKDCQSGRKGESLEAASANAQAFNDCLLNEAKDFSGR